MTSEGDMNNTKKYTVENDRSVSLMIIKAKLCKKLIIPLTLEWRDGLTREKFINIIHQWED